MALPPLVAIASHNAHKLREIRRICADWPVQWVTIDDHDPAGFPEVPETGTSYLDNARLKAHAVADTLGTPALADDSGIEVDALGGKPGVRSARYAGEDATDEDNLRALTGALRGIPQGGRTARYRCVVVLADPDGSEWSAEGVCEGMVDAVRRGNRGFGYDPIFVPVGWEETMAELTDAQKDRISHRGRALRELKHLLEQRGADVGRGIPDSR
jgi:XTP/dITP diphosphohydrolase